MSRYRHEPSTSSRGETQKETPQNDLVIRNPSRLARELHNEKHVDEWQAEGDFRNDPPVFLEIGICEEELDDGYRKDEKRRGYSKHRKKALGMGQRKGRLDY